jgi:hypothetical protein
MKLIKSRIQKTANALMILSSTQLFFQPLALAAKSKKPSEMVKELMQETNLGKRPVSAAEMYLLAKKKFPAHIVAKLAPILKYNANEMMPKAEFATMTSPEGQEFVRITLTKGNHRQVVDFYNTEDVFARVNGQVITKEDVKNWDPYIEKIEKADAKNPLMNIIVKPSVFERMTVAQKEDYILKLRKITFELEQAQVALGKAEGTAQVNPLENDGAYLFWKLVVGDEAFAAKLAGRIGTPCVIAGNLSHFGRDNSCGSQDSENMPAWTEPCGGKRMIQCNEFIYGYNGSGGPICVPVNTKASVNCDKASPIQTPENKKALVHNVFKALDIEVKDFKIAVGAKGQKTPDLDKSIEAKNKINEFLVKLDANLDSTYSQCEANSAKKYDILKPGKKGKKPVYSSQKSACDIIRKRANELRKATCETVAGLDNSFQCPPYPPEFKAAECDSTTQTLNEKINDCCDKQDNCCNAAETQEDKANCYNNGGLNVATEAGSNLVKGECEISGQTKINGSCVCPAELPYVEGNICVKDPKVADSTTPCTEVKGQKRNKDGICECPDKKPDIENGKCVSKGCSWCSYVPWVLLGGGALLWWLLDDNSSGSKSGGTNTKPVTGTIYNENSNIPRTTPSAGGVR